MDVHLVVKGTWEKTLTYLKKVKDFYLKDDSTRILEQAAQMGVDALAANTPKDSGLTASSWSYNIINDGSTIMIEWVNDNMASGWFNVAIALQYGHGTGTGGWVQGYDYINPAIRPVFDNISEIVWEVVKGS